MKDLLKQSQNENAGTNFLLASCTLDAGVKIYAYRVDCIHSEAYKILSSLGRATVDNEEDNGKVLFWFSIFIVYHTFLMNKAVLHVKKKNTISFCIQNKEIKNCFGFFSCCEEIVNNFLDNKYYLKFLLEQNRDVVEEATQQIEKKKIRKVTFFDITNKLK